MSETSSRSTDEQMVELQAEIGSLRQENIALQDTLDRLSVSEQSYRQLMELASEGIFRVEYRQPISVDLPVEEQTKQIYQQFQYAEHNPAFAQMYGYEETDALVGTSLAHIMDAPENAVQMTQFVRNEHQMRNQETVEFDRFGRKRYFLNNAFSIIQEGYAISAWGTQVDITELRETQQALLQAAQEKTVELTKANEELQQRDRLLSVVAQVTKDLLEAEDVDIAIPAALQAVGEAAKISRVQLIFEQQDLVTQKLHHRVAYEWVAEGICSQMNESDTAILDNEDFSFIIDKLHGGHSIWRLVDDYPTPIRAIFESIEIKSSGTVPIFIEGRYIGGVAFDDCSHPRQWSPQEINVLAAAAESIGAALHRKRLVDRLVEERIQAVLEERSRFSREIHDTLAQAFTGVLMQLEASKRKITAAQFDAAQDHIARARSLALEGLSEARRSVRALRPEILESSDLPSALRHLSQQTMADTPLTVTLRVEGTPCALPMDLEADLLRISQEAITNTLRHAQAQTIRLELLFETEAVHLQITDDGLGFDPGLQLVNGGFGLVGMQERSQRLGGQFTLKSSHGQGTAITVTVPLERRDRLP